MKNIAPLELGTKQYSLALGSILSLRKELIEHKHAQLSALTMLKIASKIQLLGFEKQAEKLFSKLGKPQEGLYQDISEEKKQLFIDTVTTVWEKGYNLNVDFKKNQKMKKRTETLTRLASQKREKALACNTTSTHS